jgi:hypothetical protein
MTIEAQNTQDSARISGVKKRLTTVASILVGGVAYTPTQIIAIYQNDLDGMAKVAAAKLALAEARVETAQAATTRKTFDRGFKLLLEGQYGNSPATLGDFGIAIAVRKDPTVEVKAAALTKTKATRLLRHTMGKTQKKELSAAAEATTTGSTVTVSPVTTGVATVAKS